MQHPIESRLQQLPTPDTESLGLSDRLVKRVEQECGGQGAIPFDRFMELALYAPGLGYYANGLRKFGEGGDFVTSPELSPLFGRSLANQCAETLEQLGGGDILEFGAGSGRLAADILAELQARDCLPGRYLILDLSGDLQSRQRELLQQELPDLIGRIDWLDTLPGGFSGVVIANEVLDAMPVSRFRLQGNRILEQFVSIGETGLQTEWRDSISPGLEEAVESLIGRYGLAEGYESELNRRAVPWLQSLGEAVEGGLVLLVDYGYSGREFYHPERSRGTLVCHYRQRVHYDPLLWPGLQDISGNVDFSALAYAAEGAGFDSHAFTSQAFFLLANGIEQMLDQSDQYQLVRDLQAVKRLTLPNEMGERFKVLGLGKGLERLPVGFGLQSYPL